MRKIQYIVLICSVVLLIGCEGALGPDFHEEQAVKTESKWRVSTATGEKISIISYKEYNREGKIISEIDYNINDERTYSKFEYHNNRKVEHEYRINASGDTLAVLVHNYILDDGKVSQKTTETLDGKLINNEQFVYDMNGNITEKKFCADNENCNNTIKYDNVYSDGSLSVRYTFENDGSIAQKDSIVYSNNNYFEKITSDSQGNIFYITGYDINSQGSVTSETIKNESGQIIEKFIYEFTYFD